jgi:hypothetical protein
MANIAVNATGFNPGGVAVARVTYTPPTATDLFGATVQCVPPPDTDFTDGQTTVTCTARDAPPAGAPSHTAQLHFTVTVVTPNVAPTFTAPASGGAAAGGTLTKEAEGITTVVNFTPPTATDRNGASAAVSCNPAPGHAFAYGDTTVSCSAQDPIFSTVSSHSCMHACHVHTST